MGNPYPPLDREQVEYILKKVGFSPKRKGATDHTQWEGYVREKRRIVTVKGLKSSKEKYGHWLLSKMIGQSGLTKEEFYSCLNK